MIAVIVAAATMQACGGLDFLVRIAEKILRRNPRMITVLAPVVAYIFTSAIRPLYDSELDVEVPYDSDPIYKYALLYNIVFFSDNIVVP